jgi:ABC-2 type transport system ATP-binding protein
MSSHVLSEVDRVCDRIALLRKGEMVLLATVDESRRRASRHVRVWFSADVSQPPPLPPGHEIVRADAREWTLNVEGLLGPLLTALAALPVKDLEIEEPKLEEVVLKYYRGTPE